MYFEGHAVPGAEWIEIVTITNKDGSPLDESNWRRKLFGRITLCWIAGGLRRRGAFFRAKLQMKDGKPEVIDLYSRSWCSTTEAQPIEVVPGVYDFETNTSIYRLRLLNDEEVDMVMAAVRTAIEDENRNIRMMMQPPAGDIPLQ